MFWVRIRLGGREYPGVLDTGATISIVAKKILPRGSLANTMPTAAIRMGDGHVVHSCGDCELDVPMGSRTIAHRFYVMDTEALDFVLGTDIFVQHSQIQYQKDVLDCFLCVVCLPVFGCSKPPAGFPKMKISKSTEMQTGHQDQS